MKKLLSCIFLTIVIFFTNISSLSNAQIKQYNITIGTGNMLGSLYPIGISIGKIININAKLHGVKPTVTSTEGDVYNIDAVIKGDLNAAIVNADAQYRAYKGMGEWAGTPQLELRSIISISPEYLQLIVSENSKIKTLVDLEGKTINLGQYGVSTRLNAENVLRSYGFDNKTVNIEIAAPISESFNMIQDGRIDGFFISSIIPLDSVKNLTSIVKCRMIDIVGADLLFLGYPEYKIGSIPKNIYPRLANPNNIQTVSTMSTLVASSKMPNAVAYVLAREIVENLDILKGLHPSLKNLNLKDMLKHNTAPIHPGAIRYYQDKGLL